MKARILLLIVCLTALLVLFTSCSVSSAEASNPTTAVSSVTETETLTELVTEPASETENDTSVSETVTVTVSEQTTAEETTREEKTTQRQGLFSRFFSSLTNNKTENRKSLSANEDYDFSDCCFVGNSRVLSLYEYGLVPEADVYAKVGLNIRTVYTDSVQGSSLPVYKRVNLKKYDKLLLVFGDNEIGWPHLEVFISEYEELIDKLREAQGERVEIYIQSVLPVSKDVSDRRTDGYSLTGINNINKMLKDMCDEKGCTYIGTPDGLTDTAGYLKSDAASDGVHFGSKYCKLWLDYLKKYMG